MIRFMVRRLLSLIPTLIMVSFGVYLLIDLVPGDPAARLAGGEAATTEQIELIRSQLRLDDPLPVRYVRWLGDAVRLDLGDSLFTKRPVMEEILHRIPTTLSLTLAASVIAVLIGVPLGLLSAVRAGGKLDSAGRSIASLGVAVPNFIVATILVVALAVRLRWLPSAGYVPFLESPVQWLRHMLMPAFALGIAVAALIARQVRAALVDVMDANYIRTAWAKGCSPGRVIGKHALKNVGIPAVTTFGLQIGRLLGGAVIVEQIFSVPGLGDFMLRAIVNDDFPVVLGVTLFFVIFQLWISLGVDLAYGALNPKIRLTS